MKTSDGRDHLNVDLSWEDIVWSDPDGGRIVLHGVLPTTVHPQALRPRLEWHALALLEGPEIEDVWQLEEESEKESPGINLASSILGGGIDSAMIEDLTQLEEIQTGRFPDPEPRRLHRLALRHNRPVYCIEPTLDDSDWEEQRTLEAKVSTHWRKLLGMVRIGKKWKKAVKVRIFDAVPPPKNVPRDMATASVLTAAWWDLTESRITPELSKARDLRFAKRLRGALAVERAQHGDDATLILPMVQTWRPSILAMLETNPEPEEIISSTGPSDRQEEE
ncbi:MAG: hypothetical protein H2065_02875 [Candidatus Poseidoniales archaeon]|nr:hypothetical protein [Candidatus Poseidoniales archaeon]